MSKPIFLECSVPTIDYRGYKRTNNPLNIALCIGIHKSQYRHYPDNDGIPALTFSFGTETADWLYKVDADRDAEYQRVLDLYGVTSG